jgi:hypothetical protein
MVRSDKNWCRHNASNDLNSAGYRRIFLRDKCGRNSACMARMRARFLESQPLDVSKLDFERLGSRWYKLTTILIERKLVREIRAKPGMPVWRRGDEGRAHALIITKPHDMQPNPFMPSPTFAVHPPLSLEAPTTATERGERRGARRRPCPGTAACSDADLV